MNRTGQNHNLSGVLLVNKPSGMTSFEVVKRVRRALGVKKIGHTGTLDPLATGLLVLCINQATKIVPFIQEGEKVYDGSIILGLSTDTDDITGRVTAKKTVSGLTAEEILQAAEEFVGPIEQVPPDYSAVKYQGRPGYVLARRGEKVRARSREVMIHSLTITGIDLPRVSFKVAVSKGTYIRSLAADLGRRLRTGACLESLCRLTNASFNLDQALALEEVDKLSREGRLEAEIIPLEQALSFLPAVCLNCEQAHMVANGRSLSLMDKNNKDLPGGLVRVLAPDRRLLAVYEYDRGSSGRDPSCLKPVRIITQVS